MRTKLIVLVVLSLGFNIYAQSVKIPFFGKMTTKELCGTANCLPDYGIRAYVHKNDRLFYDENYNSILGRKFKGKDIFNHRSSGVQKISDDDVNSVFKTEGIATLDKRQKKDFDAKLAADLKQILQSEIQLPDDLKAQLLTKLNNYIQTNTNSSIDFSFEILVLKKGEKIETEIEQILSTLKKGEKLITGISVITINGKWETNVLKNVLSNFEIETGIDNKLSGEIKMKYDNSKNKIVSGTIKPFAFIIGDSYLIKN